MGKRVPPCCWRPKQGRLTLNTEQTARSPAEPSEMPSKTELNLPKPTLCETDHFRHENESKSPVRVEICFLTCSYNAHNKSSSSRFLKAPSKRVQSPINLLMGAGEALRDLFCLGSTGLVVSVYMYSVCFDYNQ